MLGETMRKVILYIAMSLDGYIAKENGEKNLTLISSDNYNGITDLRYRLRK